MAKVKSHDIMVSIVKLNYRLCNIQWVFHNFCQKCPFSSTKKCQAPKSKNGLQKPREAPPQNGKVDSWVMRIHFRVSIKPIS